jgi:hypothetical protein
MAPHRDAGDDGKTSLSSITPVSLTRHDGSILVTVLIVMAVLFSIVLAFTLKVQLNLTQAENF